MAPVRRAPRAAAPLLVAIAVASSLGCAHYFENRQATGFDPRAGYRFDNLPSGGNSDSLFVCLSFSGGGTRAAALSYGVLDSLRKTEIELDGRSTTLLDEVDCISSVSGGSFTAAYYGLFGDAIFEEFHDRFLERNIESELLRSVFLNPWNWWRLASPHFDRIDLAAELYHEKVFDRATFEALRERGRPFLMINATNMETGRRLAFTQPLFDVLGSELESYPVSRAVAASSAFPFLLSPITLINYPEAENYELPDAAGLGARDASRARYEAARAMQSYRTEEQRWVHLMDGGLADNIGTRAILDAYRRGFVRKRIDDRKIRRLVVIVVNARTEPTQHLSESEDAPGLIEVAAKTATIAMDNYGYESVSQMIADPKRRVEAQRNVAACNARLAGSCPDAPAFPVFGRAIDPYVIEVNFERVADLPGDDPEYYLNLPTSFALSKEQVQRLVQIGPKLLADTPQWKCLIAVLKAEAEGGERPTRCPIGAGISGY